MYVHQCKMLANISKQILKKYYITVTFLILPFLAKKYAQQLESDFLHRMDTHLSLFNG